MKQITLAHWLRDITHQITSDDYAVLAFTGGSEYPLLFFNHVHAQLRTQRSFQSLDVISTELVLLENIIHTPFLGQVVAYHLMHAATLDAKKLKKLQNIIASYHGPHRLLLWFPATIKVPDLSKGIIITIPDKVDKELLITISKSFGFERLLRYSAFFTSIITKVPALSLESACMLLAYGMVLGADWQKGMDEFLDHLVETPSSLFALSGAFFSGDAKTFGALWHDFGDRYQMPFWITFWSEQLFRAACVVRYYKAQQIEAGKKIGYRLPFSFLNTDFKRHSYSKLMKAHNALYSHDFHLKNGGDDMMIELFYAQFFAQTFNNKHI